MKLQSMLVVAMLGLGTIVAVAAPGDGGGDAPKHAPPQAAFDACAKAKEGDACSFKGMQGKDRSGTCETPKAKALQSKGLVCRVAGAGGGSGATGSGGGAGSGSGAAKPPAKPPAKAPAAGAGSGSGSGAKK